jgi:hypothetical protein
LRDAKAYRLVVETPSRHGHGAFDEDLRLLRVLERAQKWQQEEPWVMPGDTLHPV